jgi:diketogulonate reductase-like aldo/keto reductase
MKTVDLASGDSVPALGLGTWRFGEDRAARAEEIATLRTALDLGVTLIDTAEMYGDGAAETLIGEAIAGRRGEAFVVSKVYPRNATRKGTAAACERSLKRLKTDRIDLYLLHWRQDTPLGESVEALAALERAGKIRHWGVSNLDLADMRELWDLSDGRGVQTDQLLYNLSRRSIEWDLLPWLRERRIPVMAYSPIEQARLLRHRGLVDFAKRHGATPAQAALAWLLSKDGVVVIPKTGRRERLRENLGALGLRLSAEQLAELDRLFPPAKGPRPLEML